MGSLGMPQKGMKIRQLKNCFFQKGIQDLPQKYSTHTRKEYDQKKTRGQQHSRCMQMQQQRGWRRIRTSCITQLDKVPVGVRLVTIFQQNCTVITLLTEWGDFHSYRSHPIPRVGVLFLHVFTSSANTYQNDRTKFNRYTNMEIDSCIRQNMAKRSIPSCGIAVFHVGPSMVTRRNSGPGSWSGNASRGKLSMLSR